MEKKKFSELKGVCLHKKDGSEHEHEYKCRYMVSGAKESDYEITHQGDPIFMIDIPSNTIKVYIVKILIYGRNGLITLFCCERGKQRDFKPIYEDLFNTISKKPFDNCIRIEVPSNKSRKGIVSTTLNEALEILNSIKNKKCFAALCNGDKVYSVNKTTNVIEELTILAITKKQGYRGDKSIFEATNGVKFTLNDSYYGEKASVFNNCGFAYYGEDKRWHVNFHLFVNKKKAEAFVKERNKNIEKKNKSLVVGTDTKLKDCQGNPIRIGDTVVYANGGGSYFLSVAKVINFTDKMIRIFDEKEKQDCLEYRKKLNNERIDKGLKPYEFDDANIGIKLIGIYKVLVIKT